MEKQKNISVIPLFTGWSDLGDWQSVWKTMKPDQNGLALSKNGTCPELQKHTTKI